MGGLGTLSVLQCDDPSVSIALPVLRFSVRYLARTLFTSRIWPGHSRKYLLLRRQALSFFFSPFFWHCVHISITLPTSEGTESASRFFPRRRRVWCVRWEAHLSGVRRRPHPCSRANRSTDSPWWSAIYVAASFERPSPALSCLQLLELAEWLVPLSRQAGFWLSLSLRPSHHYTHAVRCLLFLFLLLRFPFSFLYYSARPGGRGLYPLSLFGGRFGSLIESGHFYFSGRRGLAPLLVDSRQKTFSCFD
ncbi:hypothetical protein VTK73DRAFT_5091 [Phialemonium thermophilum]|uniref:Uncharacterized protein n=1 Tax=Phialemonium thermophilum TaxID=223376 RepID=A0ABR3V4J6_9PEZI